MDARELIGPIDKYASPHSVRVDALGVKGTILRALRLLAAAESNDGSTPVCDALRESLRYQEGCDWVKDFTELAEHLERERNGLAARVGELEKELHGRDVRLVEATYGQPCPTPKQRERMQEITAKAMAARGSRDGLIA